jgi:hypothetical protein
VYVQVMKRACALCAAILVAIARSGAAAPTTQYGVRRLPCRPRNQISIRSSHAALAGNCLICTVTNPMLRLDPWRHPLRGVRRPSIQDLRRSRRRLPTDRLRQQHCRHTMLDVHQTLVCRVLSDYPPISRGWTPQPLPVPGVRLFRRAPPSGALRQHRAGVGRGVRRQARTRQQRGRVMDRLPRARAPGVQVRRTHPALDLAGRDRAIRTRGSNAPRRFGPIPARQWYILLAWQRTSRSRRLRPHLMGNSGR